MITKSVYALCYRLSVEVKLFLLSCFLSFSVITFSFIFVLFLVCVSFFRCLISRLCFSFSVSRLYCFSSLFYVCVCFFFFFTIFIYAFRLLILTVAFLFYFSIFSDILFRIEYCKLFPISDILIRIFLSLCMWSYFFFLCVCFSLKGALHKETLH